MASFLPTGREREKKEKKKNEKENSYNLAIIGLTLELF